MPLELDTNKFYYLQAQAWHLKGYLGGTHSYCTFFNNGKWAVVELTDIETLEVQQADILYHGTTGSEHAPFISYRPYNAKWFGHAPYIVDSCPAPIYSDILFEAKNYPIKDFKILTQNCNTFTSYLINQLNLPLKRPLRSVGFRNRKWWNRNYGT